MKWFLIVLLNLLQLLLSFRDCLSLTINNEIQPPITDSIYFLYYTGPTVDDYIKFPYNSGFLIGNQLSFDPKRETMFYFPGFTEQPTKRIESVNTIVNALLTRGDVNIVVLDYSELVKDGGYYTAYLIACLNAPLIGEALATFFTYYVPRIQSIDYVHLVGHSLGSQVISFCAQKYTNGAFKWITGLDPANPLFNIPLVRHLSNKDGEFVDIIHTDSLGYGDGRPIGHIDFYPNMGVRIQPYCEAHNYSDFCSHHMSWRYYAESILYPFNFPAKFSQIHLNCLLNPTIQCQKSSNSYPIAYMGYGVNHSLRGDYILKTAAKSPFGLKRTVI